MKRKPKPRTTMNKDTLAAFENELKMFFDEKFSSAPQKMKEACEYALFGGGKRVRPQLCFLSCDFSGEDERTAFVFATAIELIHTYSLIHDDLPCMDNDDYRRGKPTVHKKFGEAIALLAGDALLNAAYELLFTKTAENPSFAQGAKLIADCAGINGMIGGQTGEFVTDKFDLGIYTDICTKKTGALIYASIMAPCLNSGDNRKKSALSTFARAVGLGFQASDDLLDKEKHEDASFVSVIGEKATKELLERTTLAAKRALDGFPEGKPLLEFCLMLSRRTY